jgi:ABC-2 type transport system ATP-binding protein
MRAGPLERGCRMSVISVDGLTKSYGRVVAVNGFSLKVEKQTIMGLIGPNGAGKTTVIKILLGLLRPDKGQVKVFGEDPWDNPSLRSKIGVVHEKAYFPSNHNVLEYLKKVCRVFGKPESRAREVLALVELQDADDRAIKGLSAGMLQKFAIAHALIHEPSLIVADEPTSNLDPQARSDLLDLIMKLHNDEKVTFLISSHILPELSRICESVTIMALGKAWASGKLAELTKKLRAETTRITTDNPAALANLVGRLDYVDHVEVDGSGFRVSVKGETSEELYSDVPRLAREINAKILGIESGTASLEELFRLAIRAGTKESRRGR